MKNKKGFGMIGMMIFFVGLGIVVFTHIAILMNPLHTAGVLHAIINLIGAGMIFVGKFLPF